LGGGQIALVWIAVLAAGVARMKMGADEVLTVAELVPVLRLKEKKYAPPKRPPATFVRSLLLLAAACCG
jgi:hypothetical protein